MLIMHNTRVDVGVIFARFECCFIMMVSPVSSSSAPLKSDAYKDENLGMLALLGRIYARSVTEVLRRALREQAIEAKNG